MKKVAATIILFTLTLVCTAAVHKYYAAVFNVEHVPKKKILQVTARIFVDDIELAFKRKSGQSYYIGAFNERPDTSQKLQEYLNEKIAVKVNGKSVVPKLLGREMEDDILVCYFTYPATGAIKTFEMKNTLLMDTYPEQQNIVHVTIGGNKKSLLLTNDNAAGTLSY